MLEISLVPKQSGSAGPGKFYPHTGYFGLTPVVVSGTIVSRLAPLCRSLPIRQVVLTIRCVAIRTAGVEAEIVLWERAKRLWEPAGESEYEELGNWETPFQLGIAPDVAKETASTQWTRDLRIVWRFEVAFDHKPIPYVGTRIVKTYLLDLHSHVVPSIPPLSPPAALHIDGAQILVNAPHGAFGPGDTVKVLVHVKPDDPATIVRRASLTLDRRTECLDPVPSKKTSTWRRSHSPYSKLDEAITTQILEASCTEPVLGEGGTYTMTMSVVIPRRGGRWDVGESGATKLTRTSFIISAKVMLKSKRQPSKEVLCSPIPILLVGSSVADRAEAQSYISASAKDVEHPKAALPKRRHKSSRRGLYMQEGTVEISDPVVSGRRRRIRSADSLSPLLPNSSAPADVKPILLPPSSTPAASQSISFSFPARAPAVPITTLIHPPTPTVVTGATVATPRLSQSQSPADTYLPTPPQTDDDYDYALLRQFQSSGRRISTTTSEEEEIQPSRSRPRLTTEAFTAFESESTFARPSLPSLQALGLGLPNVPAYDVSERRPRTAPVHTAFTSGSAPPSAGSVAGGRARAVPPPLSGAISVATAGYALGGADEAEMSKWYVPRPIMSAGVIPRAHAHGHSRVKSVGGGHEHSHPHAHGHGSAHHRSASATFAPDDAAASPRSGRSLEELRDKGAFAFALSPTSS